MNADFHIWMSIYDVMTSTQDKYSQWLYLRSVHFNIEGNTQARNKNHLVRVYSLHPNIHITNLNNLFEYFQ